MRSVRHIDVIALERMNQSNRRFSNPLANIRAAILRANDLGRALTAPASLSR
jgi:hypothetical protein